MPEDSYLKLAAREGERHEQWVIADLESEAWDITDKQREVKLTFPAFELLGHIDGIAKRNGDKRLLEIKSLSRFRYQSFISAGFERFRAYAYQITAYQKAVQLPVVYVIKNRDTGQMRTIELDKPPVDFEQVYDTVMTVELAVRKKQLCPATRTEDFTCRICRFRYLCEPEETVPVQMDRNVLEAAKLRRRALELEAEMKELRAEADPVLLSVAKQHGSFMLDDLSIVYVPEGESVSYPVTELRKVVSADVLEQVKRVKKRSEYIRVEDIRA